MKAVMFDGDLRVAEVDTPARGRGDVLIRVRKAGICNTDQEILKGYVPGFAGIPGHEFVGTVVESDNGLPVNLRVTAEINAGCGTCSYCVSGLGRHCPQRTVMGIVNRSGAFAEYVSAPAENVVAIPDEISDIEAVFIEPVAAACAILEQVAVEPAQRVLVLGDGKLALLVAFVLQATGCALLVCGKHREKLAILAERGIETVLSDELRDDTYDIVVEATGSPNAFATAVAHTRPRGTLVLKSTYAGGITLDLAAIVVNELHIVGSRCGRFSDALAFMLRHRPPLERLVTAEYPLEKAGEAFECSARPGTLKVLLTMP